MWWSRSPGGELPLVRWTGLLFAIGAALFMLGSTGEQIIPAVANCGTFGGAACFFVGAALFGGAAPRPSGTFLAISVLMAWFRGRTWVDLGFVGVAGGLRAQDRVLPKVWRVGTRRRSAGSRN